VVRDTGQETSDGFEAFYREQHGPLVSSLLLFTGDAELAREAADEAFARALARWGRVGVMASPGGWTYRVALNLARRRGRRRALERRLLARGTPPAAVPAPAGEAWLLVADLPRRQRQVLVLRHVADLPEAEIAQVLGIGRSTVSSTLADAHRALHRRLAPAGDPRTPADANGAFHGYR
jgi:DNA-directed RNA polymerase specialized sigma24 family protein